MTNLRQNQKSKTNPRQSPKIKNPRQILDKIKYQWQSPKIKNPRQSPKIKGKVQK